MCTYRDWQFTRRGFADVLRGLGTIAERWLQTVESTHPSAKVKKYRTGLCRKAMVTRLIHYPRFIVWGCKREEDHAIPQNPMQSSQYLARIVRIVKFTRIAWQCTDSSNSHASIDPYGHTGMPVGYFCTFADVGLPTVFGRSEIARLANTR